MMGRKKGYQRAPSEMSQTSEYHFGSLQPNSTGNNVPFFLKSLASSSHHVDQFENSTKVIGASHSVIDTTSNGHGSGNYSPRHSESSAGSFYSNGYQSKTNSNINVSKKLINREFIKNLQNDDDDWDDKIDSNEIISYPNVEDLKITLKLVTPLLTPRLISPIKKEQNSLICSNCDDIINDPFAIFENLNNKTEKLDKFINIIKQESIDLTKLKKISWNGIPLEIRPIVWQILLGYLPTNQARRVSTLSRKRQEYLDNVKQVFDQSNTKDQMIWHQIEIDVPRTNPQIKLYQFDATQKSLEKILYLWAIRHPASGYVQGINDLCTPIYQVFLSLYLTQPDKVESFDSNLLDLNLTNAIELDTFWCLTKILDTIQDNYIHEQPGIIRQVNELRNLVKRIDQSLIDHFEEQGLNFLQFSFRWMNCLLMRELNIKLIIRMWDTYISEFPNGFNEFHVYVCLLFLMKFSDDLKDMEFQDIILYLQDLGKTKNWKLDDVDLMMSELFIWQSLYKNASAHLK